jgi:hypothetical protein
MELSAASFLPSPTDTVTGRVSCAWVQDGAFLGLHMGDPRQSAPEALWLISRDESTPDYTVLYYDARRVSRVYAMRFAARVWTMWRQSPGFWQRYEGQLSNNDNTITAHWEKSTDGTTWEHDFNITYTRVTDYTG